MAIQISGNTIIDDSQNITSTGNATFASYVESDLFSVSRSAVANKDNYTSKLSTADTGKHFNAKDTGGTTVASINADGSATLAGYVKSTNGNGSAFLGASSGTGVAVNNSSNTTVIELNYDGSATFAGSVTANGLNVYTLAPLTNGGQLGYDDPTKSLRLYSNSSIGTNAKTQFHFNQSGTADITFNEGGSATFGGTIISGSDNATTGTGSWIQSGGGIFTTRPTGSSDPAFACFQQGSGTYKAVIKADGSATFAGAVVCLNDPTNGAANGTRLGSTVQVAAPNAADPVWFGYQVGNSSPTSTISADGSATFAASIVSQNNAIIALSTASTHGLFVGRTGTTGNLDNDYNASIRGDGSAKFSQFDTSSNSGNGVSIDIHTGPGGFGGVRAQSTDIATSVGEFFAGYRGSNPVFQVLTGGDAMFAGTINGTTVGTSDIKFKENIEAAPSQLSDISAFELKTFDWKDEAPISDKLKSQRKLGLIAQEVEAICPEMVYEVAGQGDDSYKAINHDVLIMKLLGAVKELAAEVASLKAS